MKLEKAEDLSHQELAERLLRVSLKDPQHLKKWLAESGRRYLVFDALDLVDSLEFPTGIKKLMEVIASYRDHRLNIPSGEFRNELDPTLGKEIKVSIPKSDVLTVTELDRAIRFLISQITQIDSSWVLERTPM